MPGGTRQLLLAACLLLLCVDRAAAQATCGDPTGDGSNQPLAFSDTLSECGSSGNGLIANPLLNGPGVGPPHTNACAGAACDFVNVAADRAACCVAHASCADADGAGPGTEPYLCDGDTYVFAFPPGGGQGMFCAGADLTGQECHSYEDHFNCCTERATCGAPDPPVSAPGISDADCGDGFIARRAWDAPDGAPEAQLCVSTSASGVRFTVCDVTNIGAADHPTCCVAQATCGDADGAGASTAAVSDAQCGAGYMYNAGAASARCGESSCDPQNSDADRAACCVTAGTDCAGSWSACTSACELAADRTWTETTAQSGSGAACPAAADCASGEDACVIPATCGDADGEGAGTAAVSDEDCGPGFLADASAAAVHCVGISCDVSGTPADKAACCVSSTAACVGQCCEANTQANAMKAWWCVARGVCH
jgi:hypothetical protein